MHTMLETMILAIWPVLLAVTIAGLLERYRPWRRWTIDRLRWLHAAVLLIFSTVLANALVPLGYVGMALLANEKGWGLLNIVPLPIWIAIGISLLALDLTAWVSHWAMHKSPFLWRMHRVHHSDEVIDMSTAFRFNPVEILFRFLVKIVVILCLGPPALAIGIIFVLNLIFDVWEHANITTPKALKRMSGILITPDVHRIHHADDSRLHDSNLGTIFAFWDRMFGTFTPASELDDQTRFGLGAENQHRFRTLADLLFDPFRKA